VKIIVGSSRRLRRTAEIERLSPVLRSLGGRCPPRGALVEVNWVGERSMAALNEEYRRRTGAAEILTFSYGDGPGGGGENLRGEIYVCWALLTRGARCRRVPPGAYAVRLIVHGLFHLRGFGHDTAAEEARMEAAERRFLRQTLSEQVLERLFA
jgi:probable rRNA maturation factor